MAHHKINNTNDSNKLSVAEPQRMSNYTAIMSLLIFILLATFFTLTPDYAGQGEVNEKQIFRIFIAYIACWMPLMASEQQHKITEETQNNTLTCQNTDRNTATYKRRIFCCLAAENVSSCRDG